MDMSAFAVPHRVLIPELAVGVWQIVEADIDIPVYTAHTTGKSEQGVVDDPNSALYSNWGRAYCIGDHYGSEAGRGIWNMSKVAPGMLAYFHKPDGVYKYQCYMSCLVDVKGRFTYYCDGHLVEAHSSKDIACTSCVGGDSTRNYMAVFRYIDKEK